MPDHQLNIFGGVSQCVVDIVGFNDAIMITERSRNRISTVRVTSKYEYH